MRGDVAVTMLVRFPGMNSGVPRRKRLRGVLSPGVGALGAPSAWLFLIRLHACRAGLRFTRHSNCSSILLPAPARCAGQPTFLPSIQETADA